MIKIFMLFLLAGTLQLRLQAQGETFSSAKEIKSDDQAVTKWIENLYEIGFRIEGDSIYISDEVRKIAADSTYRNFIYLPEYTMEQANFFFGIKEFKIAFWYLINVYHQDPDFRDEVIRRILSFEPTLEMDKVLIATFYTYAFLDPEVTTMKSGRPDIHHPEKIEDKLASVKTMVGYIMAYRQQPKNN